jgi:hypothetical protein
MIDKTAILTVSCVLAAVSYHYVLGKFDDPVYPKVTAVFEDSVMNRQPLPGLVADTVVTIQYCDS